MTIGTTPVGTKGLIAHVAHGCADMAGQLRAIPTLTIEPESDLTYYLELVIAMLDRAKVMCDICDVLTTRLDEEN